MKKLIISTFEHGGDPVRLMRDRGYTYDLLLNGESIAVKLPSGGTADDLRHRH